MDRRAFLRGALSLIASPAIVRATSLMPIRAFLIAPAPPSPKTLLTIELITREAVRLFRNSNHLLEETSDGLRLGASLSIRGQTPMFQVPPNGQV